MSNQITVARDLLVARWRETAVATASGITEAIWNSADQAIGHVFKVAAPGAVNRGRLPIVRLIFGDDNNDMENDEGGMATITFDVEVIVGGVFGITSQERAEAIMSAGEYAMRNNASKYWHDLTSSGSAYEKGPMWTKLSRTFSAELTWEIESV